MEALHTIEKQLAPLFKDLPAIPKGFKDFLVQYWPYIALFLGVVQLFAAWSLFALVSFASSVINYANTVSVYTGQPVGYTGLELTAAWVGIAVLVVNAIIFIVAFSPLTKKAKRGWDLLFLATLINAVYGLTQVFISVRGFGGLLSSLVGTAIGLYLLFQIRDRYTAKKAAKTS
ncbi:MAG: hypothetical protein Q7T74_00260 [Candidatus Saccharibacteria bacterium]|nr:hypothetical protein [Candidatus Saccharibacteria bacterium]